MGQCPQCNGFGELCDGCDDALSAVSRECDKCGFTFCAIAVGAGTRVSDGVKVDIGSRDCFTGHDCQPGTSALP